MCRRDEFGSWSWYYHNSWAQSFTAKQNLHPELQPEGTEEEVRVVHLPVLG